MLQNSCVEEGSSIEMAREAERSRSAIMPTTAVDNNNNNNVMMEFQAPDYDAGGAPPPQFEEPQFDEVNIEGGNEFMNENNDFNNMLVKSWIQEEQEEKQNVVVVEMEGDEQQPAEKQAKSKKSPQNKQAKGLKKKKISRNEKIELTNEEIQATLEDTSAIVRPRMTYMERIKLQEASYDKGDSILIPSGEELKAIDLAKAMKDKPAVRGLHQKLVSVFEKHAVVVPLQEEDLMAEDVEMQRGTTHEYPEPQFEEVNIEGGNDYPMGDDNMPSNDYSFNPMSPGGNAPDELNVTMEKDDERRASQGSKGSERKCCCLACFAC